MGCNRAPHPALLLRLEEDHRPRRVPGLRVPVDLSRRVSQVPPWPARQLRRAGLLLRSVQDDLRAKRGAPAQGIAQAVPEPGSLKKTLPNGVDRKSTRLNS